METALSAVQLPFYLLSGLGLFFTGVGMLWFVSVFKAKQAQERAGSVRRSRRIGRYYFTAPVVVP